jgi:hypothetical protein
VTPGQEALVEAMRFEQARIYGQRQIEYKAPAKPVDVSARLGELVRMGRSNSEIMAVLPVSYETVRDARKMSMRQIDVA